MALLWSAKVNNSHYEVKSAGSTVRLYTDGVFHSQYNSRTGVSGGIWDLLMLPAFFHKPDSIKRILVLGVGGGAVLRMFLDHLNPESITGIELDPVHIDIAQNYFGLKDQKVELIEQDAVRWMKGYKGAAFDLIVEDLFCEHEGEPVRAITADCAWTSILSTHLSKQGMIISNFISRKEICHSGYERPCRGQSRFESAWLFTDIRYENRIAMYSRLDTSKHELLQRLERISMGNASFRKSVERLVIKRLRCN